jgi:hypothetical protein
MRWGGFMGDFGKIEKTDAVVMFVRVIDYVGFVWSRIRYPLFTL